MAKFRILRSNETDIESTDIWRFVAHEGYPTQKVAAQGQATVTIASGDTVGFVDIPHGLGYQPQCRVSVLNRDGYVERICGAIEWFDGSDFGYYTYGTDGTNLTISVGYYVGTAPADEYYTFYYIILHES